MFWAMWVAMKRDCGAKTTASLEPLACVDRDHALDVARMRCGSSEGAVRSKAYALRRRLISGADRVLRNASGSISSGAATSRSSYDCMAERMGIAAAHCCLTVGI